MYTYSDVNGKFYNVRKVSTKLLNILYRLRILTPCRNCNHFNITYLRKSDLRIFCYLIFTFASSYFSPLYNMTFGIFQDYWIRAIRNPWIFQQAGKSGDFSSILQIGVSRSLLFLLLVRNQTRVINKSHLWANQTRWKASFLPQL